MHIEPRFAISLFTVLIATGVSTVAHASEPGYDSTHVQGFEETTGYELTEEGVREALENLESLRYGHAQAVLSVVGEMKFVSLTPYLKRILATEPIRSPQIDVGREDWIRHATFWNSYQAYAVRALIRCGDPEAPVLAVELAKRLRAEHDHGAGYAIRSIKYLVHYPEFDVVGAIVSLGATRELVELEHYFRFTLHPRRRACRKALEEMRQHPSEYQYDYIESRRTAGPGWRDAARLTRRVAVHRLDYPLLDEILDYILYPQDR